MTFEARGINQTVELRIFKALSDVRRKTIRLWPTAGASSLFCRERVTKHQKPLGELPHHCKSVSREFCSLDPRCKPELSELSGRRQDLHEATIRAERRRSSYSDWDYRNHSNRRRTGKTCGSSTTAFGRISTTARGQLCEEVWLPGSSTGLRGMDSSSFSQRKLVWRGLV